MKKLKFCAICTFDDNGVGLADFYDIFALEKKYCTEDKQFSSIGVYEYTLDGMSRLLICFNIRHGKDIFKYQITFDWSTLLNVQLNAKHVFTVLTNAMRVELFSKIVRNVATIRQDFNLVCDAAQDNIYKWRLDHGLFAESHGCCPVVWAQRLT